MTIFVFSTALQGCDSASDAIAAQAEKSALAVNVDQVMAEPGYTIQRDFAGRVESRRASQVGFELGGELDRVMVEEGDFVSTGAALAKLDTARLEARLAEANAALAQAESGSELASRTLERSREAASFDGISAQELDLAIDAEATARAALAATAARVNSVEVDLAKSTIRAPFDAIITSRFVDEGQIVPAGQPVLGLQETAAPEVRIGVAGGLSRSLEQGQQQQLIVDGQTIEATVKAVLPLRDPATRTVDVILSIQDADVLPGDLARLSLEQRVEEPGFWLPIAALAEGSRGLWTAYVAMPLEDGVNATSGATHYLQPRPVEILYEATERVFVRGALSDGDMFVTGGLTRVVPNQQVRLADGDAVASLEREQ